jgi:hypothetical protein
VYYWNSGNTSVQWCARSIVGANYPVEGPFNQCGGNEPLPTTTTTTTTTGGQSNTSDPEGGGSEGGSGTGESETNPDNQNTTETPIEFVQD